MKNKTKNMILALALTTVLSVPAFAEVLPKTNSTVTGDRITVGDVFEGVTSGADHYLAPAPAPGQSMTLTARDLTRISNALNLGWDGNGASYVTIRRVSNAIDRYDIQAALEQKMSEDMNGQKFELQLNERALNLPVPEGAAKTVTVEKITTNAAHGEFRAVISASASPDVKKEVTGRFFPVSKVPVLTGPLRPGDVITAADIEYVDMLSTAISPTMITDAAKLIGQTPRRGIAAMKPLLLADVQAPVVIKKGDLVTMTLSFGGVHVTAQGRAMENGATGDAIHVMNSASKQVVDAVITGMASVAVKSPLNTL